MEKFWQPGDVIVSRSLVGSRVWAGEAVIVVEDTPQRTALLLMPGAECAFPEGYFHWRRNDPTQRNRWDDALAGGWQLRHTTWHTNRFLLLLEPEQWYATCYIWDQASDVFRCYYVNFQLPYRRMPVGFDSLDLDLDIVVPPDYQWHWKDEDEYAEGLRRGGILPEWGAAIERAKPEVLAAIKARRPPFDGAWLNWRPPAEWQPPRLLDGWETAGLSG